MYFNIKRFAFFVESFSNQTISNSIGSNYNLTWLLTSILINLTDTEVVP